MMIGAPVGLSVADEPGFFDKIAAILDPGGDPDAIRHRAAVCRTLSQEMTGCMDSLHPVAADLGEFWAGQASDGYQASWAAFKVQVPEYVKHLNEAAASLDRTADIIHQAQVEADHLKIALGLSAVAGVALFFVTLGTVAAAEAVALEAAAGAFATWLAASLGAELATVEAVLIALEMTAGRFALGAGGSAIATGAVKAIFQDENPFDPANWSADDVAHVLLDGIFNVGIGALADSAALTRALEGHPYVGSGAAGGLRSGLVSGVQQFSLNGKSLLDPAAWLTAGQSAGVGFGSGVGVAVVGEGLIKTVDWAKGIRAPKLGEVIEQPLHLHPTHVAPSTADVPGLRAFDLFRGAAGVPSGMINYVLNFGTSRQTVDGGLPSPPAPLPGAP